MAFQIVYDKVIIGAGISGVSCFNWFARHSSKQSVLLIDRNSSLRTRNWPKRPSSGVLHTVHPASIASGCWVTPPLPESQTNQITSLLADAYPIAIDFYDRLGLKGSDYPWRLYRKPSISPQDWSEKVPKWYDLAVSEYRGDKVFEARGNEFRFFEDPAHVLATIIEDSVAASPACRYLPDTSVTNIEPKVKKHSFGSSSDSSTHVIWNIFTKNSDRPIAQARKVIFATGADFVKQGEPTDIPELKYLIDGFHVSKGSVLDLSASSPFPPFISQQNMVISPVKAPLGHEMDETSNLGPTGSGTTTTPTAYYGRLGSTQRVNDGEILERSEELLAKTKDFFPELPNDVSIVGTRTGERLYRSNRLPVVGGLIDAIGTHKLFPNAEHGHFIPGSAPRLSGLYFIGGLGSRGFTLAPLISRMLVEQICGPFELKSTFLKTQSTELRSRWWPRMSPRGVLSKWLRQRPQMPEQTHWQVNWPTLLTKKAHFPADYTEASNSFDTIPTSWNPNRTHFESTYCPLFDDDHTRD